MKSYHWPVIVGAALAGQAAPAQAILFNWSFQPDNCSPGACGGPVSGTIELNDNQSGQPGSNLVVNTPGGPTALLPVFGSGFDVVNGVVTSAFAYFSADGANPGTYPHLYLGYEDGVSEFLTSTIDWWNEGFATLEFSQAIPEPASIALVGLGLGGLGAARRRRRAA